MWKILVRFNYAPGASHVEEEFQSEDEARDRIERILEDGYNFVNGDGKEYFYPPLAIQQTVLWFEEEI